MYLLRLHLSHPSPVCRPIRVLAAIVCTACLVSAQTVTAPIATPAPRGDVVELSPFVIASDRDEGWVAASTLAANRTNTELINVAASIDAITTEFMHDFSAYTLEETAKWV